MAWSLAVPIFEAPDEPDHWQYARYLHDTRRLPLYNSRFIEANSPPLYYLLVAPFASEGDAPRRIGDTDSAGSPRWPALFEHKADELTRYIPLRIARLVSVGISVLTVMFCYLTGTEATGNGQTGWLAASLMAFLPQFAFRGMNISNDALVALMGTVATFLSLRLVRRGFNWRTGTLAAAAVGVAFLSKATALFLVLPLALAVACHRVHWRARLVRLSSVTLAPAMALPWLVRNQMLYGDPLASRVMLAVVPDLVRPKPIWSPYFVTAFPYLLYHSFVGVFGWFNVWLPTLLYLAFGGIAAAAALGYRYRRPVGSIEGRLVRLLLTIALLNVAVVVYINLTFTQPQGRYLFPSLAAIVVLMAMGLEGLPGWSRRTACLIAVGLALANVYAICCVIIPTYWRLPA